MAEITDWKARYRDALRDMEHRERGWRDFELALRRLIGRLCRVGTGQSPSGGGGGPGCMSLLGPLLGGGGR